MSNRVVGALNLRSQNTNPRVVPTRFSYLPYLKQMYTGVQSTKLFSGFCGRAPCKWEKKVSFPQTTLIGKKVKS